MNTLREASQDEKHKVFLHMKSLLPDSAGMYCSLDMDINYNLFDGFNFKFYVPTNKNQLQSLVVMYPYLQSEGKQDSQVMNIFWDDKTEKIEDVMSCLKSLPNIDWNKKYSVRATCSNIDKFKYIAKCFSGEKIEIEYKLLVDNYIYEKATPDIKLPPGFRLGSLNPKHVSYVHSLVDNNMGESESFVAAQFNCLPSSAVYKITGQQTGEKPQQAADKQDHESNPHNSDLNIDDDFELPVAFSSVRHMGAIGRTFTLPEYRGLGMAKVVTQDLIKKLTSRNSLAWLSAEENNYAAIRTYEKLGFVKKSKIAIAAFESFGE